MNPFEHLREIPLFAKLDPGQLELLTAIANLEHFHISQAVVHQGDLANRFFVVDEGYVNLRQTNASGFERSIGVLPAAAPAGSATPSRNYFGEQMFTTQEPFAASVYAVTELEAWVITRADFDVLLKAHPELLNALPFIQEAERNRTRGYEWVGTGETVALVARKHWWALLPSLAIVCLGALLVLALTVAASYFQNTLLTLSLIPAWLVVLGGIGYALYDWTNDQYVVTNQRVAHVERVLLTQDLRESVPIDKVQGVEIDRHGLSGYFGVGHIIIQSAARLEGNIKFAYVSNAAQIRKIITTQQDHARARLVAEEHERYRTAIQKELRDIILPHVVAQEQARQVPPPTLSPVEEPAGISARIRRMINEALNLELLHGSTVIWRKHWVVLLRQSKYWWLALIGLDMVFVFIALNPAMQMISSGGYVLASLTLVGICLFGLWWEWTDWRNDIYMITDTQIIDSERLPFGLREKSITASLEQVQDVRVDMKGIIAFFLNFGDVKIETAGKGGQMVFKGIHNPREAADQVFQRIEAFKARRAEKEAASRNRVVVDAFIGYHRLKKEEERIHREAERAATDAADTDDYSAPDAEPPPGKARGPLGGG